MWRSINKRVAKGVVTPVAVSAASVTVIFAAVGNISTIAGDGAKGFSGDAGPAINGSLNSPRDLAVDASGNLFIADQDNHRVRRVDATTGVIETVAGVGFPDFFGDGGPAVVAALFNPYGVAIDTDGYLYIADFGNQRIRRIDSDSGVIETVAGSGDIGPGSGGFSSDGEAATGARLNFPTGVDVDPFGNIFIADHFNHRIRRVDGATGVITTVAGNGTLSFSGDGGPATSSGLNHPSGVTVDTLGNVFIADRFNHRVRRVDGTTGLIETVAGNGTPGFSGDGGSATSASLKIPQGVAVDPAGNVFVADTDNNRIRRVDAVTGVITTIAGNGEAGFSVDGGPATTAKLNHPFGVTVDTHDAILIADSDNHRVRKVDLTPAPQPTPIPAASQLMLVTMALFFATFLAWWARDHRRNKTRKTAPDRSRLTDPRATADLL